MADCWLDAAARYGVRPLELAAIACVESGLRPDAVHANGPRTAPDVGLMQINASHLAHLAAYGVRAEHLRQPCVSIMLGAWVLARAKAAHGDTWQAIGAYNAGCSRLKGAACQSARARYAWQVWTAMRRLEASGRC